MAVPQRAPEVLVAARLSEWSHYETKPLDHTRRFEIEPDVEFVILLLNPGAGVLRHHPEVPPSYSTFAVLLHDRRRHLITKLLADSVGDNKSISTKLKIVPTASSSLFNLNNDH